MTSDRSDESYAFCCWNTTLVSFKKFFPKMNSSKPPDAGQLVKDFLQISGTPGGCAKQTNNFFSKTTNLKRKTKNLTANNWLRANLQHFSGAIIIGYGRSEYHPAFGGFLFTSGA